ncbi:hypothetical protein CSAL01_13048 [Colletotrichum salicis]|uniref:Uncharacterized protein n=1 Tax=Colletotrichum salicis TaxID=1209931 RepID=A0A135V7I3_9PEZI|nr:hypothetical protein CSAL01_13048 [Colletotrichum salicis]
MGRPRSGHAELTALGRPHHIRDATPHRFGVPDRFPGIKYSAVRGLLGELQRRLDVGGPKHVLTADGAGEGRIAGSGDGVSLRRNPEVQVGALPVAGLEDMQRRRGGISYLPAGESLGPSAAGRRLHHSPMGAAADHDGGYVQLPGCFEEESTGRVTGAVGQDYDVLWAEQARIRRPGGVLRRRVEHVIVDSLLVGGERVTV